MNSSSNTVALRYSPMLSSRRYRGHLVHLHQIEHKSIVRSKDGNFAFDSGSKKRANKFKYNNNISPKATQVLSWAQGSSVLPPF